MKFIKKGCESGCSFFIEEYNFELLTKEDQISIEQSSNSLGDEKFDFEKYHKLFFDTQKGRCVGGLLNGNEVKKVCKYYKILPDAVDIQSKISLFSDNYSRIKELPWKIATFIFIIISTYMTYISWLTDSEASDLKNKYEILSREREDLESKLEKTENSLKKYKNGKLKQ